MALILCPYCKKTISDTAEICIHCGQPLRRAPQAATQPAQAQPVRENVSAARTETAEQKTKNYEELPFEEKKQLRRQFNAKYPQYTKYDERDLFTKKSKIFEWIFFVATLLVCILMIKLTIKYAGVDDKKATACEIVFFVVFGAFCISDTVENIVRMKQRKKRLRVLKLYVKWLHDEKGVVYKVKFDKQYAGLKQYYDRINVDYEKI